MSDFAGLTLRDDFGDGEARIRDIELGERLGYSEPRFIRRLISNLWKEGHLPGIEKRADSARSRTGPKTQDFWLDERGALLVASQSGMDAGIEVTKEVIEVFVRYRRGELPAVNRETAFLFRDEPCDWDEMWDRETVFAICRVYDWKYIPGGHMPRQLRGVMAWIYRLVMGAENFSHLRALNPDPRQGSNHHLYLPDMARNRLRGEMPIIRHIADQACKFSADPPATFRHEIKRRYGAPQLQTEFVGLGALQ